ncbi:hypothetical protein Bhyg_04159 [Pseudolycoriella hygida]|uniref:Uncharacterized protein n=1 Tax=Pseudolycoriella hygida TaxID=35572 RepID=A0A9Q0NFJ5_9DIPT|nr:hypothetical protein Bhyg_04159 [Pseudolycoriella hygida]
MSVKIRKIILCLFLLVVRFTTTIGYGDCLGKRYLCGPANIFYLLCFEDPVSGTYLPLTSSYVRCPTDTICTLEESCDPGATLDCQGKPFFCGTENSFLRCGIQDDGTYRSNSTVIEYCTVSSCDGENDCTVVSCNSF